jgi:hypothetical protein
MVVFCGFGIRICFGFRPFVIRISEEGELATSVRGVDLLCPQPLKRFQLVA